MLMERVDTGVVPESASAASDPLDAGVDRVQPLVLVAGTGLDHSTHSPLLRPSSPPRNNERVAVPHCTHGFLVATVITWSSGWP